MELKKQLINYKDITLKLIESIEDIELVESLIEKRQEIIDKISMIKYESAEFKEVVSELGLQELEEILSVKLKKEKVNAKNKIDNIRKLKQARSVYNKREAASVVFNIKS